MKNKFNIGDVIIVLLDNKRIFGEISAIKIESSSIKYDVMSTFKLFDVQEYYIEIPSEHQDLSNI